MDINRLREFVVLSDCLNYSKAANQLYITQPVLSRHIHDLEETFGGQLFIRDTHKVELTETGKICAKEFRRVLEIYDEAIVNIKNATDFANDTLAIGFLEYAVRPFLIQFNARFHELHPGIQLDYTAGHLDNLIEAILNESLDLAFVTHASSLDNPELSSKQISEDQLFAVFGTNDSHAGLESITLAELAELPFINFSKKSNPITADFHEKLFARHGLNVKPAREVSSLESGLFYARIGAGVFLIPQHLTPLADDLITMPLADEEGEESIRIPLNLVWKKKNAKKSLKTFVREFTAFYRSTL